MRRCLLFAALAATSTACAGGADGQAMTGWTGPVVASMGTGEMTGGTGSSGPGPVDSSGTTEGVGGSSGGTTITTTTTTATTGESSTGAGETGAAETGPPPAVKACAYPAAGGVGLVELMVPKGSSEQIEFVVPGLPDPAVVVGATLRYRAYDADHPGQEGEIFVNAGAAIEMPAEAAGENAELEFAVDVTGRTIAGSNKVAFGAGSFDGGTFYRVGQVRLELQAELDACPEPPPPPAEARQLGFEDAVYTQRNNWVLRCDFLDGYAFTAKGDQLMLDCGKLYMPDGTTHGTATFLFKDVAPGNYLITIKSRHTTNRNPKGALFVVAGEGRRVKQNDALDFWVDTWGTKQLAGDVEVVLDSSMEIASDSVTWVRLEPI